MEGGGADLEEGVDELADVGLVVAHGGEVVDRRVHPPLPSRPPPAGHCARGDGGRVARAGMAAAGVGEGVGVRRPAAS